VIPFRKSPVFILRKLKSEGMRKPESRPAHGKPEAQAAAAAAGQADGGAAAVVQSI
jgi:hypothetical protein